MKNKAYIPIVVTSTVVVLSFFGNMVHYNMGRNFQLGKDEEKPIWAVGNFALIPPKKDLFQIMLWSLAFSLVLVVLVQIAERKGGADNPINAGLGTSTEPMQVVSTTEQVQVSDPTMTNEAALVVEEQVLSDDGSTPTKSSGAKSKSKK